MRILPLPFLIIFSPLVLAQDSSAPATFGNVELSSGYTPDPHTVEIAAGGSIDASSLASGCVGNIANAPDVQLEYDNGSLPLIFSIGSDSDTTLVINLPNGSWICDDDGGDGLNPMIELSQPMAGVYDIWVGTYSADGYPDAMLYISELEASFEAPGSTPTKGSSLPEDNTEELDAVTGTLEAGDEMNDDGSYQDSYRFPGTRGEQITVDLRSDDFDSYLTLITPSGETLTNDDYQGSTSRSLITTRLEESGQYTIRVSSFFSDETGDYRLSINGDASPAIAMGDQVDGSLEGGDTLGSDDKYRDSYAFNGNAGRTVRFRVDSDAFDTYLIVVQPDGEEVSNDDFEGSTDTSVVEMELPESGRYTIIVTSFWSMETGDYTLSVESAQVDKAGNFVFSPGSNFHEALANLL